MDLDAIGVGVTWAIADYHQGSSLTISNDIGEEAATDTGLAMARQVGTQEITCETTAFGETASTDNFSDFVEGHEGEFSIQLPDGNVMLPKAFHSEGVPVATESGKEPPKTRKGVDANIRPLSRTCDKGGFAAKPSLNDPSTSLRSRVRQ